MANEVKKETKAEAFVRLAPRRVDAVIKALNSLEQLSSKNYEYTPEQVTKMLSAITEKYNEVANAYAGDKIEKKTGFSF